MSTAEEHPVCAHCHEPIMPGQRGHNTGAPLHIECLVRLIVGSVAHQQRRCSCCGGFSLNPSEDDPRLTPRQAAREAALCYQARRN